MSTDLDTSTSTTAPSATSQPTPPLRFRRKPYRLTWLAGIATLLLAVGHGADQAGAFGERAALLSSIKAAITNRLANGAIESNQAAAQGRIIIAASDVGTRTFPAYSGPRASMLSGPASPELAKKLYEQANFSRLCVAFDKSGRPDDYLFAGTPDENAFSIKWAQDRCLREGLNENEVSIAMMRSAEMGNIDAKVSLVNEALTELMVQHHLAGTGTSASDTPVSPEKLPLFQQVEELAMTGHRDAIMQLSKLYSDNVIVSPQPLMSHALMAVEFNVSSPQEAFTLPRAMLFENMSPDEQQAVLTKAQEIFAKCCRKSG